MVNNSTVSVVELLLTGYIDSIRASADYEKQNYPIGMVVL